MSINNLPVPSVPITITVTRNGGGKVGDDIIDPLLTSELSQIERGKQELNLRAHANQEITLQHRYRNGVRIGQLVEAYDSVRGESYIARIKSISHDIINGKDPITGQGEIGVVTTLVVERVTNFYN